MSTNILLTISETEGSSLFFIDCDQQGKIWS